MRGSAGRACPRRHRGPGGEPVLPRASRAGRSGSRRLFVYDAEAEASESQHIYPSRSSASHYLWQDSSTWLHLFHLIPLPSLDPCLKRRRLLAASIVSA
ncbi:hypothetical protein K1719_003418 [Acacia pycnantha]|nr:hypothetical protein K1719_003418 [Acacia pycnantha]